MTQAPAQVSTQLIAPSAVAALLAGLFGSRFVTARRDKNLLMSALQTALASPADRDAAAQVAGTNSVLKAVQVATGAPVAGPAPAAPPADPTALQADVLRLFDAGVLRANLDTLRAAGQPAVVSRDGAGLELGALNVVQVLGTGLPPVVRHMRLTDVARLDAATFGTGLQAIGSSLPPAAAEQIWQAARDAAARLARMPAEWRLTSEQLR
jgi:hypothetical protein